MAPVKKVLACNDVGNGALADVQTIVVKVRDSLKEFAKSVDPISDRGVSKREIMSKIRNNRCNGDSIKPMNKSAKYCWVNVYLVFAVMVIELSSKHSPQCQTLSRFEWLGN